MKFTEDINKMKKGNLDTPIKITISNNQIFNNKCNYCLFITNTKFNTYKLQYLLCKSSLVLLDLHTYITKNSKQIQVQIIVTYKPKR